jgi:hypothetical protein
MAYTQHIGWPLGDDRVYELEILQNDGKAPSDPTKAVQDVTGMTLAWVLTTTADLDTYLIEKRTGGLGIVITGVYNVSRAVNTQRVEITIEDSDTEDTNDPPTFAAGIYAHALNSQNLRHRRCKWRIFLSVW